VQLQELFALDPDVVHLNHGSFGATPVPVREAQRRWQDELERQPVEFLARRAPDLLDDARAELAAYVGARADDLVFVQNATAGLNAVIRSLELAPGDEVLTTAHEYGALLNAWDFSGATLVRAEPDELAGRIGPATRAVYLSHVTSPTAIVLPVAEACAAAREAGVLSIVDGAHGPGHLPLDLDALGADVYVGNCHKWLCAPKGAGFLWARPEHHEWIEPLVVGWGWKRGATLAERHGPQGTRDPSAFLAVPDAIAFVREHCRADERLALLDELGARLPYPPVPGTRAPFMGTWTLPPCDAEETRRRLYDEHRVEVVVQEWEGRQLLRVSSAPYNDVGDVDRLLAALDAVL
jgi:isopenicillin-N epimerase